ncbi:MAG: GntR family transcriptional regulator [bacterium]
MKITSLKRTSLVDQVEEKLREFILTQGLRSGDALPGEMKLAGALNVSRPVIREAVSRLRMLGLVDSRKRLGMVVAQPDFMTAMKRLTNPAQLDEATAHDVFELRLALEIGVADLLFIRKTAALLRKLELVVEQEEQAPAGRFRFVDCEVLFHDGLISTIGNGFAQYLHQLVASFFDASQHQGFTPDAPPTPGLPTHRDILEVLRTGTAKRYRDVMSRHFSPYFKSLQVRQ